MVSLDCLRHSFFLLYLGTIGHLVGDCGLLLYQIDTLLDGAVNHFWGNSMWVVGWTRGLAITLACFVGLWCYALANSLTYYDLMYTHRQQSLAKWLVRVGISRTILLVATALVALHGARRGTPIYDALMATVWYLAASVLALCLLLVGGYAVYDETACACCWHLGPVAAQPRIPSTALNDAYKQEMTCEPRSLTPMNEPHEFDDGCRTPPPTSSTDTTRTTATAQARTASRGWAI